MSDDQRKLVTTGLAVVLGCVIAWVMLVDRKGPQPQQQIAKQSKGELRIKREKPRPEVVVKEEVVSRPLPPPTAVVKEMKPLVIEKPAQVAQVQQPDFPVEEEIELPPPEPVIPLEVARFALGFVGADPQAEEVWYQAINDPNMPAKARQD